MHRVEDILAFCLYRGKAHALMRRQVRYVIKSKNRICLADEKFNARRIEFGYQLDNGARRQHRAGRNLRHHCTPILGGQEGFLPPMIFIHQARGKKKRIDPGVASIGGG